MLREEAEELVVMVGVQCGHTSSLHHISKKMRRLPKSFGAFARRAGHSTNIIAVRVLEHLEQMDAAEEARISHCGPSAGYG